MLPAGMEKKFNASKKENYRQILAIVSSPMAIRQNFIILKILNLSVRVSIDKAESRNILLSFT